jgi:hypothetical protein
MDCGDRTTLASATAGLVCQTVSWDLVMVAKMEPPLEILAARISLSPSCVSNRPFTFSSSTSFSDAVELGASSLEASLPSCEFDGGVFERCFASA